MGWRPTMITGLLRDLLACHFAIATQIEDYDLRHLVWRQDERTGILIESLSRWRGTLVGKRPAILIKGNGRQNIRLFLGDRAGTTEQGFEKFQTFWVGSHTLFCIHGSGASAEILASEVEREIHQFHPVIVRDLDLYKWQVTEVGGIAELEEAAETFVVPVTVGWTYSQEWQLDLESRILRAIPLDILLDGALVNAQP